MNTTEKVSSSGQYNGPFIEKDHGYFNSATLRVPMEKVFAACQEAINIEKALSDLPEHVHNFLKLSLLSAEPFHENGFKVVWENLKDARYPGTLTFIITKAPMGRGTWITAEALFDEVNFKHEGPSTLVNLFLKRMKALIETGEIPTTKGQPSGREEIDIFKESELLH